MADLSSYVVRRIFVVNPVTPKVCVTRSRASDLTARPFRHAVRFSRRTSVSGACRILGRRSARTLPSGLSYRSGSCSVAKKFVSRSVSWTLLDPSRGIGSTLNGSSVTLVRHVMLSRPVLPLFARQEIAFRKMPSNPAGRSPSSTLAVASSTHWCWSARRSGNARLSFVYAPAGLYANGLPTPLAAAAARRTVTSLAMSRAQVHDCSGANTELLWLILCISALR